MDDRRTGRATEPFENGGGPANKNGGPSDENDGGRDEASKNLRTGLEEKGRKDRRRTLSKRMGDGNVEEENEQDGSSKRMTDNTNGPSKKNDGLYQRM
ncbi:hypothetical protein BV898_15229 [Hypsibius exemplaris]|uniref:Uncharacterized protein n=1 Tax=Hypsibius exemplaris TaxID=2072580 RepID=A0A9X6RK78_HYPEX|nr:hypothetical protein BV898_15229 [Hypsibius exemplaris]